LCTSLHFKNYYRKYFRSLYFYIFSCTVSFVDPTPILLNHIGGVMVSVLASSAVDRGFEPRSGQTKDYKIGICCFFTKHTALSRKSKDWLAQNQNNVSEWSDMSCVELGASPLSTQH
jgi:hypothetical protein